MSHFFPWIWHTILHVFSIPVCKYITNYLCLLLLKGDWVVNNLGLSQMCLYWEKRLFPSSLSPVVELQMNWQWAGEQEKRQSLFPCVHGSCFIINNSLNSQRWKFICQHNQGGGFRSSMGKSGRALSVLLCYGNECCLQGSWMAAVFSGGSL